MPNKFSTRVRKTLGALPSPDDPRDYTIGIELKDIKPIDLSKYVYQVKNQGTINSCVAHAINSAYEIEYYIKHSKRIFVGCRALYCWGLSEAYLYTMARIRGNLFPEDMGSYPRDALKEAQKNGIAPEYLMPYYNYKPDKLPNWKAIFGAKFFKIKRYERVFVDQIPYVLSKGKPVIYAQWVDNSLMKYKYGIVDLPYPNRVGAHAMVIVGIENVKDDIVYKVLNSWGPKWGDNGYWYITHDYLRRQFIEAWTIYL